jgi:hypothetical protein
LNTDRVIVPRGVPGHPVHVHEEPHELGDRDDRVRVVQLDRRVVGSDASSPYWRRCRRSRSCSEALAKKILLPEAQLVPRRRVVARIEHARDRLEAHAIGECADVVAAIEVREIDGVHRPRRPEPQRVHVHAAPAGDRRVVRDRLHRLGGMPDRPRLAIRPVDDVHMAAEADRVRDLRALELPGVAGGEPVLGQLDLPAVAQLLPEDPVVVADAVAVGRHLQRRHALHEAGGEAAEAAVAQAGIGLEGAELLEIDAQLLERLTRDLGEPEVPEGVHQLPPDEELEREVVDALRPLAIGPAGRLHPVARDLVARRERGGDVPVAVARVRGVLADGVEQLVHDGRAEGGDGVRACRGRHRCGGSAGTRGHGGAGGGRPTNSLTEIWPRNRQSAPCPTHIFHCRNHPVDS